MADVIPALLLLWLLAFVIGGLNVLVRRTTGLSLLEAIGISWLIGRILK